MIRLDIFSDPVCPWCYIGKTNLDRALESRADHPFQIEWHPFQLNPDMAADGVDKRSYLSDHFGGPDKLAAIHGRLREAARQAGVDMDPDTPKRLPNTLNAHRLIHWAGLEGRQTPVVSALFRAYWKEGRDIGNVGVLADIAGSTGLDRAAIARLLDGDADRDTVIDRDTHARERGVTGVPCFVVADQYVLSGAQPVALWQQAMDELIAQNVTPT